MDARDCFDIRLVTHISDDDVYALLVQELPEIHNILLDDEYQVVYQKFTDRNKPMIMITPYENFLTKNILKKRLRRTNNAR